MHQYDPNGELHRSNVWRRMFGAAVVALVVLVYIAMVWWRIK